MEAVAAAVVEAAVAGAGAVSEIGAGMEAVAVFAVAAVAGAGAVGEIGAVIEAVAVVGTGAAAAAGYIHLNDNIPEKIIIAVMYKVGITSG